MRIFRSTTLDSNANTYVGSYGEITVGDDLQLRIQDNATPGGTSITGEITFTGNVIGSIGNRLFVQGDMVPTADNFYELGYPQNRWAAVYTTSVWGDNLAIHSGGNTWVFNSDGTTRFPTYTMPADNGDVGQALTTDGAGNLIWQYPGALALGNYQFSGDWMLMPDAAKLNSGGIGTSRAAEFGTVVDFSAPNTINTSNIYMGAGTGEARVMVDSAGRGLTYFGVEDPGFAGMVSMDPGVTSQYAIDEAAGNIIIGATQPGGTITTTDYRAGIGVLNGSYTINGLYADTTHVVLSSGSPGSVHNTVTLAPNRYAVRTESGNAYTLTDQTTNRWELFAEDDLTGPHLAYSSIKGHLEDINAPNVVIETRRAYDTEKIFWTFDHTGNLTLPQNGYLGNLYGESDELSVVSPPGGSAIIGSFAGNSYVRVNESAVFVGTGYRTVPYEWIFSNDGRTLFPGYEFPAEDGSPGQVLVTNGSGILSWQAGGAGSSNSISYGNTSVSIPSYDGNVVTTVNGNTWTYNGAGQTVLPILTTVRGDTSGGSLTGFTLNIGDGTNEAVITTPDATSYNAQRLVINPGKGQDGTGGEGGDIYLWAGRGGDTNGNGGDIKIRGGYGPGAGQGGYIRVEGGDVQGAGAAGYVYVKGGDNGGGEGGPVTLVGGTGNSNGGYVSIQGGYGNNEGGLVTIQGGASTLGLPHNGNVQITSGASTWQFSNNATLYFPANGYQQQNVFGTTTQVRGIPYPAGYLNGVGTIWTASGEDVVGADLLVRAHGDNGSAAETVTEISRMSVVKDAWNLSAQPTITVYGQVNSNATIDLTTYAASTNGSNLLVITGNTIPHGSGRYFTYTVTEFKRTVD